MFMASIYSKAQKVIAWLGTAEDSGDRALRRLDYMARKFKEASQNLEWLRRVPGLVSGSRTDQPRRKSSRGPQRHWEHVPLEWEELLHLMTRPYFERVWILQEAVLAQNLWLMCGSEEIQFREELGDIAEQFTNAVWQPPSDLLSGVLRATLSVTKWRFFSKIALLKRNLPISSEYGGREDLLWFLFNHFSLQSSDPRDKVYGFLGLCNFEFVPDYRKSSVEVYTDVTEMFLNESLMIVLAAAGIGLCKQRLGGLPSWAVDWQAISNLARIHLRGYDVFDAGGTVGGFERPLVRDRVLHWSGVEWDQILQTEQKLCWHLSEYDIFRQAQQDLSIYPKNMSRIQAMISAILGGLAIDEDERRLELHSSFLFDACAACLYRMLFDFAVRHEISDSSVLEWFEAFRASNGLPEGKDSEFSLLETLFTNTPFQDDIGQGLLEKVEQRGRELFSIYLMIRQAQLGDWRLFYTMKGYIGVGPQGLTENDIIAILPGCRRPAILRKTDGQYVLVGLCFVVGIMDGEVMHLARQQQCEMTDFDIH